MKIQIQEEIIIKEKEKKNEKKKTSGSVQENFSGRLFSKKYTLLKVRLLQNFGQKQKKTLST